MTPDDNRTVSVVYDVLRDASQSSLLSSGSVRSHDNHGGVFLLGELDDTLSVFVVEHGPDTPVHLRKPIKPLFTQIYSDVHDIRQAREGGWVGVGELRVGRRAPPPTGSGPLFQQQQKEDFIWTDFACRPKNFPCDGVESRLFDVVTCLYL